MDDRGNPRGPSIADIAAAAGVSIATVSRVVNASAFVKPEAADRVREAIGRLGYVKLRSSRKGAAGDAPLVGLMLPDIGNPFFATLIKGVQSVAVVRGFDVILADSGADPAAAADRLSRFADRRVRAALVVAPAGFEAPAPGPVLDGPRGLTVPVVYMDRRPRREGIHYVGSENYQGAFNAASYLVSLGHRDMLYLAGDRDLSTESERHAGFAAGIAGAAASDPDRLVERCGYSLDLAMAAVRARLGRGRDFSAIFAADDYMAYGALTALREAGLRVPEDVSLVGFDDLPFSAMIGLTTVRQQAFELGAASMTLAFDLADGRKRGQQSVILSTSLIIRGSCAVVAKA